jgi:ABC-type transporter Mla MlaB component
VPVEQPISHLVVGRTIDPAGGAGLCARAHDLLARSGAEHLACDVSRLAKADATSIEALARLALTTRRLGRRLRIEHATPDLRALLAFAGLEDVLPCATESALEPRGKPEHREEPRRVEEERDSADPTV